MKNRFFVILGMVLLLSSALAFAGSACTAGASTGPTIIIPNGRVTDFDFVAPTGNNFYETTLIAGHSYSFEAVLDYDDAVTANPVQTTIFKDGTCSAALSGGSASTGFKDTTAMEPAAPLNAFRGTVIAQVSGPYSIQLHNTDGVNGHYVAVSVTETTMYTPFWSTNANSAYSGFYVIYNTTSSSTFTGTFTYIYGGANPPANVVFSTPIAPGQNITGTTAAGVASNKSGSAFFVYDGPPHALTVSAAVVNFTVNPPYNQVVPFDPIRGYGN